MLVQWSHGPVIDHHDLYVTSQNAMSQRREHLAEALQGFLIYHAEPLDADSGKGHGRRLQVVFTDFRGNAILTVRTIKLHKQAMEIQFTTRVFKEGRTFVAHALELDVSSCGGSKDKALKNLKEAVRLFLEEAEDMGTLERILQEAGYSKTKQKLTRPFISVQRMTLPLPLTHAKV